MLTSEQNNLTDTEFLELMHQDVLRQNLPVFVYVTLLGIVGMVGNSLTLIVYCRKSTKSATNIFIESIAIVDLLTNVICIPIILCVLSHVFQVHEAIGYLCHLYFYFNYLTASTSAILLVAVAYIRFRKICSPFGYHMRAGRARLVSCITALTCLILCAPHAVVHGRQAIDTPRAGVKGHMCRTDASFAGTTWPLIVDGGFIALFLLCSATVSYMYARIGATAWRHGSLYGAKVHRRLQVDRSEPDDDDCKPSALKRRLEVAPDFEIGDPSTGRFTHVNFDLEITELGEVKEPDFKKVHSGQGRCSDDLRRKRKVKKRRAVRISRQKYNGRTTRMLLVISAIYIVTNLTSLVLLFLRSFDQGSEVNVERNSVLNVFVASYLVNSTVNPIIYSVWDRNFRRQCKELMPNCVRT